MVAVRSASAVRSAGARDNEPTPRPLVTAPPQRSHWAVGRLPYGPKTGLRRFPWKTASGRSGAGANEAVSVPEGVLLRAKGQFPGGRCCRDDRGPYHEAVGDVCNRCAAGARPAQPVPREGLRPGGLGMHSDRDSSVVHRHPDILCRCLGQNQWGGGPGSRSGDPRWRAHPGCQPEPVRDAATVISSAVTAIHRRTGATRKGGALPPDLAWTRSPSEADGRARACLLKLTAT